ncbi:MAG: Gfo/Idh/MocA family oxidoreductase [Pirellulales bacterium]|nr:Gfo/Idh/MocA family oxidoreductase [Pirellulales bacterium]
MSKSNRVSRRSFLQTTGAVAATATVATGLSAKSYGQVIGANERIGVGLIGAGIIAQAHMSAFNVLRKRNNLEPVVVADCWETRAKKGAKKLKLPESRALTDYRKVIDHKDVDYVTIATPEHQHARMILETLAAGKPLYTEKPMTHTLPEAQAVVKKQKETGLAVQVGVQGMSDDSYESAGQAIREGLLGRVVQAQIEYVRCYSKRNGPWRVPGLDENMPKPDDLNWDAWLGHAPKVAWNPHHYFEWRNYAAYSGGICTDLFIHRITRIMKACDLLYPRRVVGMGGIWQWPDGRDLPDNFEMICEYPRGMTVYVLGTMSNKTGIDHLIRGHDGTLQFTPAGWIAKDKDGKVLAEHKKTGAEDIVLHHTNFHNHLRKGEPLNCPAPLGLAGVAAVCMANESWRTGRMMAWDTENEKMVPADTLAFNPYPEKNA